MSVKCIPANTPLLYSKTTVCRGIPNFLIFHPKHTLWVLVRTASQPTMYVLSENINKIKIIPMKFSNFSSEKKSLYIARASFHNAFCICTLHSKSTAAKVLLEQSNNLIRKTCPCNVYPLEPHFYVAKLGYAGVYLFFLFLLQNIDCG